MSLHHHQCGSPIGSGMRRTPPGAGSVAGDAAIPKPGQHMSGTGFATRCRKTFCTRAPGASVPYFQGMKMETHIVPDIGEERALMPALVRGWCRRCPNCGGGPMMRAYLKVRDECASCGEELGRHRADDIPAWATIFIVGHIIVSGVISTELAWEPP